MKSLSLFLFLPLLICGLLLGNAALTDLVYDSSKTYSKGDSVIPSATEFTLYTAKTSVPADASDQNAPPNTTYWQTAEEYSTELQNSYSDTVSTPPSSDSIDTSEISNLGTPDTISGDTDGGGYTSGTPKIVRMSVRGHIGSGDDERFMRFAVNGDVNVMVRAIGPALGDLSADLAPISLIDPNLSIFKGQDELPAYHNDNYTARSEASDIESISQSLSVVIPIKPVESASIGDYSTGTYYANVRDKSYSASYGTRVGWVGADITDTSASGGFSGVSTRGVIKPGDGSMFASFEIVGDANSTRRMFIRARGASLANFGVKNVLSNINLKLFYLGGDLIKQSNDYTSESNKGEIETQAKALFGDLDSTDAGMIIDLKPAYYTIWVESETGATGVGWIGVDDITQ